MCCIPSPVKHVNIKGKIVSCTKCFHSRLTEEPSGMLKLGIKGNLSRCHIIFMEYSKCEAGVLEYVWEFSCVSGDVKLNRFECSLSSFPCSARASFAGLPQVQLWIRLGDKCDHHQGSQIVLILTPVTAFPIRRWRNPLMDRSSTTSTWPAISEPFEASCKKSTRICMENLYQGMMAWICMGYNGTLTSPAWSNGSPRTHLLAI